MSDPLVLINGLAVNDDVRYRLNWRQSTGLFTPAMRPKAARLSTFGGAAAVLPQVSSFLPRTVTLAGEIVGQGSFLTARETLHDLADAVSTRPSRLQIGPLYTEMMWHGSDDPDTPYKLLPDKSSWRLEGEAWDARWTCRYGYAAGDPQPDAVPGFAVRDDRPDRSDLKATGSNFAVSNPGDAPTVLALRLSNTGGTSYVSTTVWVRNSHKDTPVRIPVLLDAFGNGEIKTYDGLLVMPGTNRLYIENSAGAELSSGTWAASWRETEWTYTGNSGNKMSECSAVIETQRSGTATYISTAGTLTTGTDSQPRTGLPWVSRRNRFTNTIFHGTTSWTATNSATRAVAYPASLPTGYPSSIGEGQANAGKLTIGAGQNAGNWEQAVSIFSGNQVTLWCYIYVPSSWSGTIQLWIADGAYTSLAATTVSERDQWVLKSVTYTAVSTALHKFLIGSPGGSSEGKFFYIAEPQWEHAASRTAYQPIDASGLPDVDNLVMGAGLVQEGERTNEIRNNRANGGTSQWVASNSGTLSAPSTSPNGPSLDGVVQNYIKGTIAGGQTACIVHQIRTVSNATVYTLAGWFYIPSTNTGHWRLYVADNPSFANAQSLIVPERDQWVFKSFTFTSTSTSMIIGFGSAGGSAATDWMGGTLVQLELGAFPTSSIINDSTSAAATRSADSAATVKRAQLVKYSHRLASAASTVQSPWALTGWSIPASPFVAASDGTLTATRITVTNTGTDNIRQTLTIPANISVGGKTFAIALKARQGATTASVILDIENQAGTSRGTLTCTLPASSAAYKTFLVTVTMNAADTGIIAKIRGANAAGSVDVEYLKVIPGSFAGLPERATDTPLYPDDADWLYPDGWDQNGKVAGNFVIASGANTAAGTVILGKSGDILITQYASTITLSRPTAGGTRSVSITLNAADNAKHSYEASWGNYKESGVRSMPLTLTVDSTTATIDAAELYGDTEWSALERHWLSGGSAFATHSAPSSGQIIGFPTVPTGAVVDTA